MARHPDYIVNCLPPVLLVGASRRLYLFCEGDGPDLSTALQNHNQLLIKKATLAVAFLLAVSFDNPEPVRAFTGIRIDDAHIVNFINPHFPRCMNDGILRKQ